MQAPWLEHGRMTDVHEQMLEELRNNREKDYAGSAVRGEHMRLGFLQQSGPACNVHSFLLLL